MVVPLEEYVTPGLMYMPYLPDRSGPFLAQQGDKRPVPYIARFPGDKLPELFRSAGIKPVLAVKEQGTHG